MGIHVRTKEIGGNKLSLYIDYYPPVKGKNGEWTRREFLKRYLFKSPKNDLEKRMNKENMLFAQTLRNIRASHSISTLIKSVANKQLYTLVGNLKPIYKATSSF